MQKSGCLIKKKQPDLLYIKIFVLILKKLTKPNKPKL